MKLFDSNACFGMDMVNHECVNHENFIVMEKVDIAETAQQLVAEMDYIGIEKAVVWHRAQYDQDPTAGNKKIIEGIQGYEDRLIPTWVILPDITDSEYAPNIFFDEMKKNGVIVNTARGSVIDEDALAEVLAERPDMRAAIDVYSVEPLPMDAPIRKLENAILLPHQGGPTLDYRELVTLAVLDDVEKFLAGRDDFEHIVSYEQGKRMTNEGLRNKKK